jgi:hypothetical protein
VHAMKLYVRSSFLASALDGCEWLASRPARFTPGGKRPYHVSYTGLWWGNLRKRDHLEDPGVDGRIILRWIFRSGIELAQDRDRWRALVNAVINLRVPKNAGNFLTS